MISVFQVEEICSDIFYMPLKFSLRSWLQFSASYDRSSHDYKCRLWCSSSQSLLFCLVNFLNNGFLTATHHFRLIALSSHSGQKPLWILIFILHQEWSLIFSFLSKTKALSTFYLTVTILVVFHVLHGCMEYNFLCIF